MNYIDNKGNYINNENLSLREIYERGIEEGKKRCSYPAIIRVKEMTDEEKQRFVKEWEKATERGLVLTSASEIEVVDYDLISRRALLEEFAERSKAAEEWYENAKDEEIKIRAKAILDFLTEVKLTIEDAPRANGGDS